MAKNNIDVVVKGDYTDKDIQRAIKDLEKIQATSQGLEGRMKKLGGSVQEFGGKVSGVGGKLTAGVTLPILAAGGAMVAFAKEAEQAEVANRKLGNVLDSMGFGEAADRVQAYAEELERTIAVDAELIKATQTKLATFKNLTATVNESGGAFDRATMAALDLAAAGFGSAESNATQLGKALQDPVKGITALARAGVTFTEQEREKIKALVESGNILAAQNMILGAIETQVGGTAAAGASSFERIRLSLLQIAETIGTAVLPLIQQLADFISNSVVPTIVPKIEGMVQAFNNMDPGIKMAIGAAVAFAAAIGPVLFIVGKLISVIGGVIAVVNPLTLKIAAVVAAVALVATAFKLMWDRSEMLRNGVATLITTVQNIVRVLISDFRRALEGITSNMGGVANIFNTVARLAGNVLGAALQGLARMWNGVANYVRIVIQVFEVVSRIMNMSASAMRGVVALAIDYLMNRLGVFSTALRSIGQGVKTAFSTVTSFVQSVFSNTGKSLEQFINQGIKIVNKMIDAYNGLADILPGVNRATHIAAFTFQDMTVAATGAAKSSSQLANEANAARYSAMAGVTDWTAYNNALGRTGKGSDDLTEGLGDLAGATGGAGSAADKASEKQKKFEDRLKSLRGALDEAINKAREYATSISDSFVGFLSLGKAYDDFTARQQAVTTALAELTKFQTEIQGDATDEQKKKLAELQKAYQDAQAAAAKGAQSIVDEFVQQGERIGKFSENLQTLLKAGLSKNAFDAILREGVDRGADIAAALVQGNVAENARRVSEVYDSVRIMGDQVGLQASTNFMSQGIIMAQAMLTGFIREFMPAGKKRRNLLDAINGMVDEAMAAMGRMTNVSVPSVSTASATVPVINSAPIVMAPDGIFAPGTNLNIFEGLAGAMGVPMFAKGGLVTGPTFGLLGEAGPEVVVPLDRMGQMRGTTINLTVNAGMGTNGPEVGRQIVDALKAYERRNGAVYVSA